MAVVPAGKAHDVMALKCRGPNSPLNFGLEEYDELLPMLPSLSKVREISFCGRHDSQQFILCFSSQKASAAVVLDVLGRCSLYLAMLCWPGRSCAASEKAKQGVCTRHIQVQRHCQTAGE